MIKAIDHITINVVSMEESIYFYGDLLKLERLTDVRMEDHLLVYFKVGDTKIELIKYDFETTKDKNELFNTGKFRHLALLTEDIEDVFHKIKNMGYVVLQPPRWNDVLGFTGMLVLDPNNCEIEFVMRKQVGI